MKTVLIADDHPFVREGVAAVLDQSRFSLCAAVSDGAGVLRALQDKNPDILVLDIAMPPPDGLSVLEQLRSDGDRRPVVLLTAHLDDGQLLRAIKADANAILLKDQASRSLVDCLETVERKGKAISSEMTERALQAALRPPRGQAGLRPLTEREMALAELVAKGLRNRQIADRLCVTEGTVKVYLHSIYQKLGVSNRTELVRLVLQAES